MTSSRFSRHNVQTTELANVQTYNNGIVQHTMFKLIKLIKHQRTPQALTRPTAGAAGAAGASLLPARTCHFMVI